MTRRDVREVLTRWVRVSEEIKALEMQVRAILDEIDAVGDLHAIVNDGMPHSPSVGRPTESAAVTRITLADRYADRLAGIERKIEDLRRFSNRVEAATLFLPPDGERVLLLKFRGGRTFSEIGKLMHLTERRVKQIEAAAVEAVGEFLEKY